MVDYLLDRYDPTSRLFRISESKCFVVSKHDVYDVFMLPCVDGSDVEIMVTKRRDNPDAYLMDQLRVRLSVEPDKEVPLERIFVEMMGLQDGGDEFKRFFVLYVMGTFLAPTSHKHLDFRLMKAVENVDNIMQQDWCSYILDRMDKSVSSWKANKSWHVGGCLMFLQLLYFHRLSWRGVEAPSSIPLLQHWTYDAIKDRIDYEYEAALKNHGAYGMGEWDSKTYPVSRHLKKRLYKADASTNDDCEITITFTCKKSCGLLTDEEIIANYKEPGLIRLTMTRRDLEVVLRRHHERGKELDDVNEEENIVLGEPTQKSVRSFSQDLEDPNTLMHSMNLVKS
ncbi:hypothetical protein vseg_007490 [Gypsophila vaccaria]